MVSSYGVMGSGLTFLHALLGKTLTILAAIKDPAVIIKILSHLGLPSRAPPRAPAPLDELLQTA
jgi:hypothetical protein